MDALAGLASAYSECATALSNGFDSEVEGGAAANCECWNALGEDFRAANFECVPEGDEFTINQLYDQQCGSSTGTYVVFGCFLSSKTFKNLQ